MLDNYPDWWKEHLRLIEVTPVTQSDTKPTKATLETKSRDLAVMRADLELDLGAVKANVVQVGEMYYVDFETSVAR